MTHYAAVFRYLKKIINSVVTKVYVVFRNYILPKKKFTVRNIFRTLWAPGDLGEVAIILAILCCNLLL